MICEYKEINDKNIFCYIICDNKFVGGICILIGYKKYIVVYSYIGIMYSGKVWMEYNIGINI